MADTSRLGLIVQISRGITGADIVEVPGGRLLGFSVFGYRSDTARVYATKEQALVELNALADAG
jgi:hypothetical protein